MKDQYVFVNINHHWLTIEITATGIRDAETKLFQVVKNYPEYKFYKIKK